MSTDNAGRFSLSAAISDGSSVLASATGYLAQRRPLDVVPGSPLLLTLEPGGVQVSGSVADASGGPIAGALVSAAHPGGPLPALALTAATGHFALTVPAGALELSARADGYSSVARRVEAPVQGIELILTPSSSLRGHVLAEGTEEPVPGVDVKALNANGLAVGVRTAITNERGAFEIPELPAGGYWLEAISADWRGSRSWVVVEIADQKQLDVFVEAATRVTGSVSVDGSACRAGRVTLTRGSEAMVRPLDPRGSVEFLGVLPGTYGVEVRCELGMDLSDELVVGREPIAEEWNLERGLSLAGRVLTAAGAPLGGARVEVDPVGEPAARHSVICDSDEGGAFTCFGLAPGAYQCRLIESDSRSDGVRVVLQEGATPAAVVLRANATATLSVRLEGAEALARDAFTVTARRRGAAPVEARHESPAFLFEKLPLGVYEVALDPDLPGEHRTVELVRPGATIELTLRAPTARALTGRVVDEGGNGVPDAWVRVSGTSLYGELHPASPVMTDAEGEFEIPGLLASTTYQLTATSNRGQARLEEVANDGRPLRVPLRSYGSMSGSVTLGDGTPAPDFVVTYGQPDTDTLDSVSGYRGEWSVPWLAPGTYEVTVTAAQGRARATVDVAAGSEETLALSLELQRPEPAAAPHRSTSD